MLRRADPPWLAAKRESSLDVRLCSGLRGEMAVELAKKADEQLHLLLGKCAERGGDGAFHIRQLASIIVEELFRHEEVRLL